MVLEMGDRQPSIRRQNSTEILEAWNLEMGRKSRERVQVENLFLPELENFKLDAVQNTRQKSCEGRRPT